MRKSKILILLKIFFPQENFYFVKSRCIIEWTKFRLTIPTRSYLSTTNYFSFNFIFRTIQLSQTSFNKVSINEFFYLFTIIINYFIKFSFRRYFTNCNKSQTIHIYPRSNYFYSFKFNYFSRGTIILFYNFTV